MKNITPKQFLRDRISHHGSWKRYRKLVMSLAAIVVFVTAYALVLPAVTLDEKEAAEMPGTDAGTQVEQNVNGSSDTSDNDKSNSSDPTGSESSGDESNVADSKTEKDIKLIEKKTEITFNGDGYKVIAEVGADAKLPADTKLKVQEIKKNTEDENGEKYEYNEYCKKALKAVRDKDGKEAKDQTRRSKSGSFSMIQ